MEICINKNLAFFEERFPGIMDIIKEKKKTLLNNEDIEVEWGNAVDGQRIMKIRNKGKNLYLSGKRNPIGPAINQINLMGKIVSHAPIFLLGLGNINYLSQILQNTDKNNIIFIYEPMFKIFYHWLEYVDFRKLIGDRIVVLVIGGINDDKNNMKLIITEILTADRIPLMKVVISPNYEHFCYKEIIDFCNLIKDNAERHAVNLGTRVRFNTVVAENFYNNVRYVKNNYMVGQLDGTIPNMIPAIVVSAGPSLNNNIMELKKAVGKAFIIAVDTAVKPLVKAGIIPDMFAMLDGKKPLELVEVEEVREIPMVAYVTGAKSIFNYHMGKKFFLDENYRYVQELFAMNGKEIYQLPGGGSVATLAFSLVCHLGFDKIILVGQDLAFTGNKSHADGTFKETMAVEDTKDFLMVPGNVEKMVPTREDFDNYRKWFEEFIEYWKGIKDVQFINATEGGALIKGTQIMTLKDAISLYCTEMVDIKSCIAQLKPVFSEEEQKKIENYYVETPQKIEQIIKLAQKAQKLYKKIHTMCLNNNTNMSDYVKITKQLKKITRNIESNPNYQIISETMAVADQIILSAQYFEFGSFIENEKEASRQGVKYMELLAQYSKIIEQIAEKSLGKNIYNDCPNDQRVLLNGNITGR